MDPKKVLVIGGGFAGIVCIAHLKKEGMNPVCYERSDTYGGTWSYRKETKFGQASIMPTTIINHSKEMGALSNFPPKKETNNYMKHSELYAYITDYMKTFDCERHIRYNMDVVQVQKSPDYNQTGRWTAKTKNVLTEEIITQTFDGVFVATGHVNQPIIPQYPGQEKFKGKIMHTHSLKEVEDYSDQAVVVVGMGCSALDAAVETSRVAKQVYLSTRSGSFIWSRVGHNGNPVDTILLRRCFTFLLDILPVNLISWYLETFYNDVIFDHRLYNSKPKYHMLSKEPAVNDHIASKLLSGLVVQKCDIVEFGEDFVIFDGDDKPTKVDTIIMATGYSWGFPFLEDGVFAMEGDRINLYKCMYPPHLPHPTLAFLGFFNSYGPGFPVGEMQARWASYLLSGNGHLPSENEMMEDLTKHHNENVKRYCPSKQISIRVDFSQYLDDIANQMGVKPKLLNYLFTDFPLFMKLVFGPSVAYQYRLEGHGRWEGAREAIMTAEERIQWPLRKKHPVKKSFLRYLLEYFVNLLPLNIKIWG